MSRSPWQQKDPEMDEREKRERAFRLAAFDLYYYRIFAEEKDLTKRFALAVAHSAAPVCDADIARWHAAHLAARSDGPRSRTRAAGHGGPRPGVPWTDARRKAYNESRAERLAAHLAGEDETAGGLACLPAPVDPQPTRTLRSNP